MDSRNPFGVVSLSRSALIYRARFLEIFNINLPAGGSRSLWIVSGRSQGRDSSFSWT